MRTFTPTDEQQAVLDADLLAPVGKIEGRAGAAKTTTLEMLARQRGSHGLYLCFNKAMSLDARKRFPAKVMVKTVHSVAWSAMGMGRAAGKLERRLFPEDIARSFPVPNLPVRSEIVGHVVLRAVDRFCNSSDDVLGPQHVLDPSLIAEDDHESIRKLTLLSRRVFDRMAAFDDPFPMRHDVYMKLWQRAGSALPSGVDWVMYDEAQDANGVQIAAMLDQQVPVTWVGDPHQSIYRFRGAINAMRTISVDTEMALTRSFRFGQEIADVANAVLFCKPPETRPADFIRGRPDFSSFVRPLCRGLPHTCLARSNAQCFREADRSRGTVHVVGGIESVVRLLRSAWALWSGGSRRELVPEIARFPNWAALRRLAELVKDPELLSVKNLVEEYQGRLPERLDAVVARHVPVEGDAALVVATFHRSKGREWDYVRICGNAMLHPGHDRWGSMTMFEREDEINLVHVAVTRARLGLEVPDVLLSFVRQARASGWVAEQGVRPVFHTDSPVPLVARTPRPVPVADSGPVCPPVVPSSVSVGDLDGGDQVLSSVGPMTPWQRRQIREGTLRGVGAAQISRVVRRPPDVVRIAAMIETGVSRGDLDLEVDRICRRFGVDSPMAEQVRDVVSSVS